MLTVIIIFIFLKEITESRQIFRSLLKLLIMIFFIVCIEMFGFFDI